MASAAWAGFPTIMDWLGRTGTAGRESAMKTLTALALSGLMLFAGLAFGQSLIGEWQVIKAFCEGSKEIHDYSGMNNRRIFDNATEITIWDRSNMDKMFNTKDCALHYKANYSMISDNQYKVGPFLEMSSPNCLSVAKHMNNMIEYAPSYIENGNDEQFGTTKSTRERMARLVASLQKIKEGNASPTSFKVSDDNQHLWTFSRGGNRCPNARLVFQHKRIK